MANAQRTPYARSLNDFAQRKILGIINQTGRALAASVVSKAGAIITVKFEVLSGFTLPKLEVPLFGPQYVRYPLQPGDRGIVLPADMRIGPMAGTASGVADLTQPGNLSALVFLPIGNQGWSDVDPDSVTIYGPKGAVLYDTGKNSTITLTPTGVSIVGKNSLTLDGGGTIIALSAAGLTINGLPGITGTFSGIGISITVLDGIITAAS